MQSPFQSAFLSVWLFAAEQRNNHLLSKVGILNEEPSQLLHVWNIHNIYPKNAAHALKCIETHALYRTQPKLKSNVLWSLLFHVVSSKYTQTLQVPI